MRERAVRFGKSTPLVGILTEPTRGAHSNHPGVLLLNSGILHRVGACRLHVNIARALAEIGFPVLRFDFSGIGDSEARKDTLTFNESAPLEVSEAMDYLQTTKNVRDFVLIGLCSGADMAFEVAKADDRVAGLVLLDAWAYRTWRFYWHYYRIRAFKLSVWKNAIRVRLQRLRQASASQVEPGEELDIPTYVREFPPKEQVETDLKGLATRRMHFFFVFSGGQEEHYNYRRQFHDTFRTVDFGPRLRVDYIPDADHIFTGLDHQTFLVDAIPRWMRMRWTGQQDGPVAPTRLDPEPHTVGI